MKMGHDRFESHLVVETEGESPVDILQHNTGLSKQRIKRAMTCGAVWRTRAGNTRRLRRATGALRSGDELHLYYDAEILDQIPPQPELMADVGGYSVWFKPYGLRSQGSKWGDHCTLVRWAERHLRPERPAFTVHRLDRAASGLMLIAHSKRIASALSELFAKRVIEKQYRAFVAGDFSFQPNPLRVESVINGKSAVSKFSLLSLRDGGTRSWLDISIETGRKHQIRRQLADLGFPVIGDRLYGSGVEDGVDLQLTAYRLAFECPVQAKPVEYWASTVPGEA